MIYVGSIHMSQSTPDLAKLFGVAINAVSNNREDLNSMDETNHPNHGDNVTHNLGIIKSALESQQSQNPSDALRLAAQRLSEQGRGSTAPQYSQGLQQAATHFQGQQSLSNDDMGLLLHSMLGAATGSQATSQPGGMQGCLVCSLGKPSKLLREVAISSASSRQQRWNSCAPKRRVQTRNPLLCKLRCEL